MLIKFWHPCSLQTLGRMQSTFLCLFLWLGHSMEHAKVAKLTSKSIPSQPKIIKKVLLEMAVGTPGLTLEPSWAPPHGPGY
jgi:hypothetical protein